MISHLREHRLCHLKIEDINKQRKAAGVAPIASPVVNAKDRTYTMSAPVGTNSRSAQQNAAQQTQQYQSNLSAAQKTPYVATYIDPATGKDTRNPTTVNTPVYYGATPENPTGTGEVSHWDTNTTMDQGKLIGSDGEPYTGQQPKQSVPKTSAEYRAAPTTGPVSTVTTLPKPAFTSQDLQAAVAQRREKRLGELGVQQGDIDKVNSLLAQGYTFNNSTMDGRPIFTKDGNRSDYVVLEGFTADKLKAVEEAKNADFTKEVTDEMAAADAAEKTARAETAKATKTAVGDTSPAAPAATPIKGPDFSMFDSQIAQVNAMVQADPNLAATYTPLLMSLAARRTQLENDFTIATTQFNNQDKDNNGVADGVEAAYGVGVEAAERRANEADRINLENRDINLAAANLAKDMAEIAQQKFELEQHRNEQLVLEQNVERERKNRLIANKLGIASGGNGLRWMAEEVRKGNDMLSYLKEAGSLQESSFALETGRNYTLNVRKATNDYASQKMQIDKQFSDDIAELKKMVNLDAKERKEERKTMVKEYMDALDKNDEKFAGQVKLFNDDLLTKVNQERDDKRASEKQLLDAAFEHLDTFGTQNKETLSFYESQLGLPPGSLSNQKTMDELRMKKAGGSGTPAIDKLVEDQRSQLRSFYPTASGEMIDQLVYAALSKQLNTANLGKAYNYMSSNLIAGETYRIQPFLTASQGQKTIDAVSQKLEDQRAVETGEITASELVSTLREEVDSDGDRIFSDDDIIKYMGDIGYAYVPGWLTTFPNEFQK